MIVKDINGNEIFEVEMESNLETKNNIIILKMEETPGGTRISGIISEEEAKNLYNFLLFKAKDKWKDFEIKDVTSAGNDYYEYYDRKFDNNGFASLIHLYRWLSFDCVYTGSKDVKTRIAYKFNKAKMQTYLYDLRKFFK